MLKFTFVGFALALSILQTGSPAAAADSDVSLTTPTGALSGTITAPEKGAGGPAALIIAGSGPTDRNGNGPAIHPNSYEMLAEGLAKQGITSLRADKRGVAQSAGAAIPETDLRVQTYVDDARRWADYLRAKTGARCIWLIGHSEGALIAEMVAQRADDVCGLVLISGPGRKLGDILHAQMENNPNNSLGLKQAAEAILGKLEAGQTTSDVPPVLSALFRPSAQPYLISEINLDPAKLLARIERPVLIMQGDNDLQVSPEDAHLLAAAKPDAKLVILPNVNHVLKVAARDRAANIAAYADPRLPIAPAVVDDIASFLK